MSFPLFRRPGTVVFLDDDADYLEMLALVLPRHWHLKLFIRPTECIDYLQQEPPLWEADAWEQQQLVNSWREGKPLIPQILDYWSRATERYALTQVCVFDYSMPGMDGLQALGELVDWPGSRVLLTGQADEQVAVRAFNRGLIDQFVAKQTSDISARLVEAVENLMATPNARHAQTWRLTLGPQENALLRTPSLARDLAKFAATHWIEHVVIGDPFGVLGMDAVGRVSWLQLERPDGLKSLAELAELEGVRPSTLDDIRQGRQMADVELRQALGTGGKPELRRVFSLGQDGGLLGALFDVESPLCPSPGHSYSHWLARQGKRKVKD